MDEEPGIPPSHAPLVERLVADAAPVRRLWPTRRRLAAWLAAVAAGLVFVVLYGVRPDLRAHLQTPRYLLELGALAGTGLLVAALALAAAVPGRQPARAMRAAALGLGALAAVLSFGQSAHAEVTLATFVAVGSFCFACTLGLALLPWAALIVAVRRGAPLAPGRAGTLAGVAAFVMAYALMRLGCPVDDGVHLLVWHAGAVALGAAASTFVGLAWLGRWQGAPEPAR